STPLPIPAAWTSGATSIRFGASMYKRILVAIDGSDTGSIAFESAMQLAKAASADLFAVYVVEYPKLYMADTGYDLTPIYDALASEGDRIAKEANERLK